MMVEGATDFTRMAGTRGSGMWRLVWIYLIIVIWIRGVDTQTLDQGSALPMCMDGWEMIDTGIDPGILYQSGLIICVRYDAVSRTWQDAMTSCRDQYGHVLLLDDAYYQIPTGTFAANLYNYMQSKGGLSMSWSGMRVQEERLWWQGEVPSAIYSWEAGTGMWQWSEPLDSRTGDCGMVNLQPYGSTGDVHFGVQLVSCDLPLPFICVNHGQTFTASPVSSCPSGWWGNIFLNSCLHYSGAGSKASHQDARASCQTMSAYLAVLTSPDLHYMATDLLLKMADDVEEFDGGSGEADSGDGSASGGDSSFSCCLAEHADDPNACERSGETCGDQEVCYSTSTLVEGSYVYTKGCMLDENCINVMMLSAANCGEGHFCIKCCSDDFCNSAAIIPINPTVSDDHWCFSCDGVTDYEECLTDIQTCSDEETRCETISSVSADGEMSFTSRCATEAMCLADGATTCCDTPGCNDIAPSTQVPDVNMYCYTCTNTAIEDDCTQQVQQCGAQEYCGIDLGWNGGLSITLSMSCRPAEECSTVTSLDDCLGPSGDIFCSFCCFTPACTPSSIINITTIAENLFPPIIDPEVFLPGQEDLDDDDLFSLLIPVQAGLTLTNPTVEDAATATLLETWIGAEKVGDELYWINGEVTSVEDARFDPTNQLPNAGCVTLDPELWTNQEWSVRSCYLELPYLCQLQAGQEPGEPIFTLNPVDLSMTSPDVVSAGSVTLTCNATNYHPDMPVVWRTRDRYINNGPPPSGFRLNLTLAATMTSGDLNFNSPHEMQGYYSCEVWGYNPYERYSSKQALLTFNDIYTYQLTLTLRSVTYDPSWESSILLHDYSIIKQTFLDTLSILVAMDDLSLFPAITINSVSEGTVVVEATLYYTVDPLLQSSVILWMGLSAEGYNNPDYLHLYTGAGIYDAILTNIAGIINIATGGTYVVPPTAAGSSLFDLSSLTMDDVQLRSTVFCPARSTYDNWQVRYDWEVTPIGEVANSKQVCLSDGVALATSLCEGNYTTGGIWRDIYYYTSCPPLDGSVITQDLQQLAEMAVDLDMAEWVAHELANLTSYTDVMTSVDVVYTSEILLAIANTPSPGIEIGNDMISTVNNILALSGSTVEEAQGLNQASTRILVALNQYTQSANLSAGNNNTQFIKPRIALSISEVNEDTTGLLAYASSSMAELTPEDVEQLTSVDDLDTSTKDTVIILSEEAVERAKQAKVEWDALVASVTDADQLALLMASQVRISFTVYQNHQLFISPDQIQQDEDGDEEEEAGQVTFLDANSRIIAGTIHGAAITDLQEPIKLLFYPLDANASSECGFWDTFAASGLGGWSTSGCTLAGEENGRLVCLCDHLTNFAILTSVTQESISAANQTALTFITVIGLSLSICGLLFTVLSFILFRKLRRGRAQKVLFNLALALLAVYLIFLVGIESTGNEIVCLSVAALLHYFLLVAFAWMLVEAILQYLKFVKVFDTYVRGFILKAAVPAWVLPGVVVGAVAGIDYNLFRGPEQYCWLSLPAFYYAFLLPVGCIIIINTILFTLVIKGITCDRPKGMQSTQSKKDLSVLQLRAAITCFVLLGLTWVFGFLAINEGGLIFQYIFCVLNSLQGFLIFIFHNVQEKSARDAWIQLCCCMKPGKHKYLSNDSASGGANGTKSTSGSSGQRPSLPIVYDNATFKNT